MKFSYFEALDKRGAKEYFEHFLLEAKEGFLSIVPDLEFVGINVDYSIDSIVPVFIWVKSQMVTLSEKSDENLPKFITESEIYIKGLYSFDEMSKILILRVSYYFAECFARSYKQLSWSIGDKKTAVQNQPVITGFKFKMELAPLLVCENLISGLVEGEGEERIKRTINAWSKDIPN